MSKRKLLKASLALQPCLLNCVNISAIPLIKAGFQKYKAIGSLYVKQRQVEFKRKYSNNLMLIWIPWKELI